jgi:hypothetical protein
MLEEQKICSICADREIRYPSPPWVSRSLVTAHQNLIDAWSLQSRVDPVRSSMPMPRMQHGAEQVSHMPQGRLRPDRHLLGLAVCACAVGSPKPRNASPPATMWPTTTRQSSRRSPSASVTTIFICYYPISLSHSSASVQRLVQQQRREAKQDPLAPLRFLSLLVEPPNPFLVARGQSDATLLASRARDWEGDLRASQA